MSEIHARTLRPALRERLSAGLLQLTGTLARELRSPAEALDLLDALSDPPQDTVQLLRAEVYRILPPSAITLDLVLRLCADPDDAPVAAMLLARPDLPDAVVEELVARWRQQLERAQTGPSVTGAIAHLAGSGRLDAPQVQRLLALWTVPGRRPRHDEIVQPQLRAGLGASPHLSGDDLWRLSLALSGRGDPDLTALAAHPQATAELWDRLMSLAHTWRTVEELTFWQHLARSPRLAERPTARARVLTAVETLGPARGGALLRVLWSRAELGWSAEELAHLMRVLVSGAPPAGIAFVLGAADPAVLRQVPAAALATALATVPRETRLVLLAALGRSEAAEPATRAAATASPAEEAGPAPDVSPAVSAAPPPRATGRPARR